MVKCSICGEDLVREIRIGDQVITLARPCLCQREERRAEQEKADRVALAEKARDILYAGYLDADYADESFDMDDGKNEKAAAFFQEYADNFSEKSKGLYIFGNIGSGKTFYASCIANAVRKKGFYVLIGTAQKLIHLMYSDFERNKDAVEYKIKHYPLMVIDDLGAEKNNEHTMTALEEIIDMRYKSKLPLIVTSNLPPKALTGSQGERMKSRLMQMAEVKLLTDSDRRKQEKRVHDKTIRTANEAVEEMRL